MKTNIKDEAARLANASHHELRNATVVAGALVGATVGMIAGVPGILAAAMIGTTAGFGGGFALEWANRRAEKRERELDAMIGVTSSELGAAEAASEGLGRTDRGAARSDLLDMNAELDRATPPPVKDEFAAMIEPPCDACVDVRRASAGAVAWCARHSTRHPHARLHYEYPSSFGLGSMLLRS